MTFKKIAGIFLVGFVIYSCNPQNESVSMSKETQTKSDIFPKGNKINNDNFIGTAYLASLVEADSTNQNAVGSVTFEPGARTNWHSHPNGQIILAIEGEGYYQEEGQPKRVLHKGDVIKCPPNVAHWHGASADESLIQIAITGRQSGPTVWLQPVTEQEYIQ